MPKRAAEDDYESDGGFVENDDGAAPTKPKNKKSKKAATTESKGSAGSWDVGIALTNGNHALG